MTRKCLLCGKSTAPVSYHIFPKDVRLLAKWKEFCLSANVEEASLHSNTNHLCTSHFLAEDYLHPVGRVRNQLRRDAVPSVICSTNGKRNYAQIEEAGGDNFISKHLKIEDGRESEDVKSECSSTQSTAEPDTQIDESIDIKMENCDDIPPATPPWHEYFSTDGDATPPNVSVSLKLEDYTVTGKDTPAEPGGKNPCFKEACYVGDIRTPHLATSRRAKKAVVLAKLTIARQKSIILNLRRTTRRLKKRVRTLKGLVQHLKQKN